MANLVNALGIKSPRVAVFPKAKVMKRAPLATDTQYLVGQLWIYQHGAGTDDIYILSAKRAGAASWLNMGGGGGVFDDLTVTNTATIGTALTLTAGDLTIGALTAGTARTSAAGVVSALADGANGTVMIGTTGGVPVWATLTAGGGINIAEAAGTITITNPGATGTTSGTDVGGPVAPTAGGLTTFEGYDLNIQTDGATANTVRIRLADDVVTVASLTATNDFTMASGTFTVTSDDNAGQAIYLHANAGVNETILIQSAQGTAVDSIALSSTVGGVTVAAGLGAANAIRLNASNAAGGIDADYGTGGINFAGVNGVFTVTSGTAAVSIGADAVAHTCTFGSVTGAASTVIQSGTGDLVLTSTDDMTLDSAGLLEFNSSAGIIGLGNDADAFNINIGTGAAQRVLTLCNTTGASQVVVDCGTGGIALGTSATAHQTAVGSTNTTSNLVLQTGTGSCLGTFGGIVDINAVGAVTVDSTAGLLSMGAGADDFAINIGTAGARVITAGNATGATSFVANVGTGNCDLGISATAHTTRLGSTNTTCDTTIQSGTGAMTFTAGGLFDINGAGNVTIDSTAGTINIAGEDIDQDVNIATDGERTTTIGNNGGASGVIVDVGTTASSFAANATDHSTDVGSATGVSATTISAGTGGLSLVAAGIVDVPVAVDTQAGAATTVSANCGQSIHTGLTTAAGATQVLTITNTLCTVNSVILATASNFGANDAQIYISRVIPAAGSFTVTVTNGGAAALNGNISIAFWLLQA